jgi:hypothetical protein
MGFDFSWGRVCLKRLCQANFATAGAQKQPAKLRLGGLAFFGCPPE